MENSQQIRPWDYHASVASCFVSLRFAPLSFVQEAGPTAAAYYSPTYTLRWPSPGFNTPWNRVLCSSQVTTAFSIR